MHAGSRWLLSESSVGVESLFESEAAEDACPLVWTVRLIDDDIGGIIAVVGAADGASEFGGVGRLAPIGKCGRSGMSEAEPHL